MRRSAILAGALSLLGFSCTNFGGKEMYGVPSADFEVKGRVSDSENRPLEDIKVTVRVDDGRAVPSITDSEGRYAIRTDVFVARDCRAWVKAEDIDGDGGGGRFEADSVSVDVERSDFKGASGDWYNGAAVKEVDIILEREK